VSGLITKRLGTFANVGDVLELGRYELRVEQTYRRQVERARLTKLSEREPTEEAPEE
jgi:CBS domain containing-hemolysin-like protein